MPKYSNLADVQQDLNTGKITLPDLVLFYLENIKKTQDLNIYIEVFEAEALAKAHLLQAKFEENPTSVGRLFGMVLSLKDVICYANHKVTAGAKILEGFESLFSATAVEKILVEDVIIIGRVNCDQFAMGSTNENTIYGPTRNAANPDKVPGGSSGASAVSVQADTCLAALGTDTGGSVRQPASFCGIIGMKPTYGRVSRYGLLAYGSSFDQIGTLSHSVEDAALLLEIMAGQDDFDATSSTLNVPSYTAFFKDKNKNQDKKSRIAYIETAVNHDGLDADVKKLTWLTIEKLRSEGHLVEPVAFDILEYLIPAYYVLTTAEASTNLSRYDGVRFGYRNPDAKDLYETYTKSRTEGFSNEVKRRIMLGTFVLSAGYFDAYYAKAQKVRRLIQNRTREIFKDYDFILLPTSPTPAWNIGESLSDPVAMYLADIFTVHANMAGIPAIALPIGESEDGLPIGIQFMADKFKEAELLAFGKTFLEM